MKTPQPDKRQAILRTDLINRQQFIDLLIAEFPDIKEVVTDDSWAGLIHLEMGCFARYTRNAIDNQDRNLVKRCFEFINRIYRNAHPDVENAIYVSYLEHLNFEDGHKKRSWALNLMPPLVDRAYKDLIEALSESERQNEKGR